MKYTGSLISLCIYLISLSHLSAQDVTGSSDHTVIGRYPGSEIKYYYTKDYNEIDLPTEVTEAKPSKIITAKGTHHSILYAAPQNVSVLEIYRNYETAINQSKGNILFSCSGKYAPDGCDDYNTYYALKFFDANYYQKRYNNTDQYVLMNGSDDQAFMLAVFEDATTRIYVEIGIDGDAFNDRAGIQVEIIEESKMKDGLITAALFEEEMQKHGKIALYGILFDTGKATIKDASKHELSLIVKYLQKHPNEKIYVVGHTDDTGGLELNLNLSNERASAVQQYLTAQGISSNRMLSAGVGPYAPITTNDTEDGKRLNRRVEIVRQL